MTRQEFIDRHFHELCGLVLDATAGRHGAEQSIWLRMAQKKLAARLGAIYDDLTPKEPLPLKPANGSAQPLKVKQV